MTHATVVTAAPTKEWSTSGTLDHALPRWLVVLVLVSMASVPLLRPAGPGNSAPVDLAVAASVFAFIAVMVLQDRFPAIPYGGPVVLLIVGGALGGLLSSTAGASVVAVAQDLLLLLWCAAIATVARSHEGLRILGIGWVVSSIGWAAVLLFGIAAHNDFITGVTAAESGRVAMWFGEPNLCAIYFTISLFVLWAMRWPRHVLLRAIAAITILIVIAYTGSNAAMLGCLAGLLSAVAIQIARDHGTATLIAVAAGIGAVLVIVVPQLNISQFLQDARTGSSLLANSVARAPGAQLDRTLLASENLSLYRSRAPIGVGAGGTKQLLADRQAPYVKEAHNDYMAAALERGVLGMVGLILLVSVIGWRCVQVSRRKTLPKLRAAVPAPQYLVGAIIAV
ncbi:MAG: O-antigen ligase family protein, partial [Actinomycetes bacterium]